MHHDINTSKKTKGYSLWMKVTKIDIFVCKQCNIKHCLELKNIFASWIKRDYLDVTCFFISLFNAQHVSDVNTSILRSLRIICWVISWVVLLWYDVCWYYVVFWLGWCGIRMQASAKPQRKTNTHRTRAIQPMK